MKITLDIKNLENVGNLSDDYRLNRLTTIFEALITSGGLTGVKGGKTVIHFDQDGEFRSIQLDYYPFVNRVPNREMRKIIDGKY
jgi:hypothetical protein